MRLLRERVERTGGSLFRLREQEASNINYVNQPIIHIQTNQFLPGVFIGIASKVGHILVKTNVLTPRVSFKCLPEQRNSLYVFVCAV